MKSSAVRVSLAALLACFLALAGCSGDTVNSDALFGAVDAGTDATTTSRPPQLDGGLDAAADAGASPPDAATARVVVVSGVVLGLTGTGLTLANGTDRVAIAADGAFRFPTAIDDGASYSVTVATPPTLPSQTCMVSNGSGIASAASPTDVSINCVTDAFTVGGTVTGLTGAGLVLENEFTDDLSVAASGPFVFPTKVPNGNSFHVTVKTQPAGQTCSVAGGMGTLGTANVGSVQVQCGALGTYAVGGQISGLSGAVVLQNNGGDNLTLTANGTFAFPTTVAPGSIYSVSVLTAPTSPSQTCSVSAGVGLVSTAAVTSVRVTCVANSFPVNITVDGLAGTGLVLQDNGGDNLSIRGNGTFAFPTPVSSGHAFNVTELTAPTGPAQTCNVANGVGTVGNGSPPNILVSCTTTTYALKATVSGLANTSLFLQDQSGDGLTAVADGTYTFATRLVSGAAFNVTIAGQNGPASCSVSGNHGNVGTADVTAVINCAVNSYSVSGTIAGLGGSLVLQNDGGGNETVSGTSFAFPAQTNGTPFSITVLTQPASPSQTCTVTNGAGTISGANVTGVAITCTTSSYTVGGTVYGLAGGTVVLGNATDRKTVTGSGPVAFQFPTAVASGATYHVTVPTQPTAPAQTCIVTNGDGAVGNGNVTNVTVNCTTTTYTLSGTVSGVAGSGLLLQDNGTDTYQVLGNGSFSFNTPIASGGAYSLTIVQQPSSPTQSCVFTDAKNNPVPAPSGTITTASDVPVIDVRCTTTPFNVGGTLTGLAANDRVTLLNANGDPTTVSANGTFTMNAPVASGATYAISVGTQPSSPPQNCVVSGGSGTVGSGAVTSVTVNCATNTFTISGTLSGLDGGAVVLQNDGGDNVTVAANGTFAFATPLASGAMYNVTVLGQPSSPAQTCVVSDGVQPGFSGTVGTSNLTSLNVRCTTNSYFVRVNVSGLAAGDSVTLQNDGADNVTVSANGGDPLPAFATQIPSGDVYDATVFRAVSASCTVASGVGVVHASDAVVNVTCTPRYSVPFTVTGLALNASVTLQDNGGDNVTLTNSNGVPSLDGTFATELASGSPYDVTVLTQPNDSFDQVCVVTNGSDSVIGNVTNVLVACRLGFRLLAQGSEAFHMCGIGLSGSLWCWGDDSRGQLGDGSLVQQVSPEQIFGGSGTWSAVSVGSAYTCGITSNRALACWGANDSYQLGDGVGTDQSTPELIGSAAWTTVSTGLDHTCGIQFDRSLWCWGNNQGGYVGDGTSGDVQTIPEQIGSATWIAISAGTEDTCGIQTDGSLWCWGGNANGELGDGTAVERDSPVKIGTATWSAISAGAFGTGGIQADGTLWRWGFVDGLQTNVPKQLGDLRTWSAISHGRGDSLAIQVGGTLWDSAFQVGTATTWTSTSVTYLSNYALQGSALWAWGDNQFGQLGDGTTIERDSPEPVP